MIRHAIALGASCAVTFGLLFLMQFLIATGREAITEIKAMKVVDFVRVKKEETLQQKKVKPEKLPQPEAPPATKAQAQRTENLSQVTETISVASMDVDISTDFNISNGFGLSLAASDGDYLPIVKVAPIYPSSALARGLEGYVIVEFVVTKTGAVRDPIVVDSSNSIFHKAAVKAALKFKYKPRVVNGEPIEVMGVRNKITFRMEK